MSPGTETAERCVPMWLFSSPPVCAQDTCASVVRAPFALAHGVRVRQALERSSDKSIKGGRKLASYDLDRRAATTLRIWRQKSRAAALARNRSARLLVGWRRRRQVAHKFGWWSAQIGRRADVRERLATLLCRRVRSTLAAALEQWQHGVAASRRVKESELQRWREWAHVESYQRRRVSSGVRHLLHRMRTRYLRASFEVWYARGERNRRLEGLLTLTLGARQPVDLQRDAFRDWRCSMRWTCRSAWREDPTVRRQRVAFELAAERLRGRLGKRSLSKVLSSWREIARHKERVSVLLQNAMARWNIGSIRGAFAVWRRLLDRRDKEDRLSAMQRLAVAHMNFRGMMNLGDCIRRWQRTVARRRRCRGVLSKCLLRMQHSLLSYALDGWCARVHSKKERKRRGTRAVARMLNMHVSGVFVQWRDTTKLVRTRRDIGQRAVKILQNNFVYTALSVWHDVVTQQKARRDVVERAVRRLRDNFLFASLNAWCDTVKRQKTLRIIGQRATKRLKNSSLFAVLDIWRKTARSTKRRRVVGSKAVAKMRWALLASALFAWQQYASGRKASAAIALRAISKLQHNTLAAALHGLRDIVRRLKSHRKVCTRALKRLFHVMLSSAFWGWQQSTAEKRSKWTIIQRAVKRLTQRLAASAFNSWMSSAYQQRKLRRSAQTIIMRLANKTLADALSTWLHSIEMHRRNRTAGERVVQHLQNRGIARAFESWWVATVETRKHRSNCRLVLNRVCRRCTVMAFEHWAEIVAVKASKVAENARQAAEQARATSMVDATVLDSVVKE
eukprot:COSAG02_NODE_3600_length_6506_cov_24.718433_4_plen_789_part_01